MRPVTFLILCLAAAIPAAAAQQEHSLEIVETEDVELALSSLRGLQLRIDEPAIDLRVGGRLHLDAAVFDEDVTPLDDDVDLRRGRLYLRGSVLEDWSFKTEYDFADRQDGWRNLWLQWTPTRRTALRVGNMVAPLGLEDVGASNHLTFLERSLPSALAPAYQTGVRFNTRGRLGDTRLRNHWTFAVMGGLEPLGVEEDDRHRSEHWDVSSRLTFAPIAEDRRLLHLGAAVEYRDVDGNSRYRIRTRPESWLAKSLVSTGRLVDVRDVTTMDFELASVIGPVSLQGEYLRAFLTRGGGREDPQFDGWYAQASWILTGEHRRYYRSRGSFGGVQPERSFGAVELAARWSEIDLNDASVNGGRMRDLTVGVNWWLRENLRLMTNYVNVRAKLPGTRQEDEPHVFQARIALFF